MKLQYLIGIHLHQQSNMFICIWYIVAILVTQLDSSIVYLVTQLYIFVIHLVTQLCYSLDIFII